MGKELRDNATFSAFHQALQLQAGGGDEGEEPDVGGDGDDEVEPDAGAGAGPGPAAGGAAGAPGKSIGLHPKLVKLTEVVCQHFRSKPDSRIIVFSQASILFLLFGPISRFFLALTA